MKFHFIGLCVGHHIRDTVIYCSISIAVVAQQRETRLLTRAWVSYLGRIWPVNLLDLSKYKDHLYIHIFSKRSHLRTYRSIASY